MIEVKETKVREKEVANPSDIQIDTLTYRERTYPVREITDGHDTYTVSVEKLEGELLDGIRSSDPFAFEIDEMIAYFCTEDQIRTLTDEQLIQIIYG